eukprot:TRINITY_DN765_c0_g1_i1.p1 TRINITY_DN765_c0_g1~~TRINITY_DN765_c0_g1_i1.p1  ORF type:complete len:335 (+),score=32.50 TRINITY_DN765_c0_g1_i1:1689-2693(+)
MRSQHQAEEEIKKALAAHTNLKVDPKTIDLESQLLALKIMEEEKQKQEQMEQESLQYAKKLEAEERAELERKRQMEEEKNKAKCEICLDDIADSELLPLDSCGHIYHPECITRYIKTKIGERGYPIKCPNPKCKKDISMLDLNEFLEEEELKKFIDYSFKIAVEGNPADFSFCPTPDCQYIFVWEKGVDSNDFECPVCNKRYCLNCRCNYHVGKTCAQYRAEAKAGYVCFGYSSNYKKGGYQIYGICERNENQAVSVLQLLGGKDRGNIVYMLKTQGCDHMRCRCGKEFCYACGGVYGNCYCVKRRHVPAPVPRIPIVAKKGKKSRRKKQQLVK